MIEIRNLKKSFGPKKVLDNVSMTFKKGEIVFVMGKSGVGKSVLLKSIVGLLNPDSGEILIDGVDVTKLSEEGFTPIRKKCGMIFQFPALLDSLNVYENVTFGLRSHRLYETEEGMRKAASEKLRLVGLSDELFSKFPQELSFGAQKRVSIARTLAVEPEYLLFDEPTTSLDPVATKAVNVLIKSLSQTLNVTSIVVSHDIDSAFEIGDRAVILDGGKAVEDSAVQDLRKSSAPIVQAFIKERDRYAEHS